MHRRHDADGSLEGNAAEKLSTHRIPTVRTYSTVYKMYFRTFAIYHTRR